MIGSNLNEPGVAPVPDEVLMKDISRRRHGALAELYGRHSKRLRATIDGVVHEQSEADDVLQEISYSRARERYEKRVTQESQTPRRDAAEGFIRSDLRHFLKKSLRALPQFQREAVELAFFKGLSHREIAVATRAPLGTVKTRLELGLQKLTQALRPLRHKV